MSSRNRPKSVVYKVPNKLVQQEPNSVNEYNSAIKSIQQFVSNSQNDLDTLKSLYNPHLNCLIQNDYFKLMYLNNYYLKKFMLNVIEKLINSNEFIIPSLLIKLSECLISLDIDLKRLRIKDSTIELYQPFLIQILPFIISYSSSKEIKDIRKTILVYLMESDPNPDDPNYTDPSIEPNLFNLIRLIKLKRLGSMLG